MNILIIGGGGREHAMAWKVRQSAHVNTIYCAPGNAGILQIAEPVPVAPDDLRGLAAFARQHDVQLTIVGPEAPLCAGIVNEFHSHGLRIFGPDAHGAKLEGSKVFAKEFMRAHGIPTAPFAVFQQLDKALAHVKKKGAPLVVKADGLAGGKGVTVCQTEAEAELAVRAALEQRVFGQAGATILIEDLLHGEEASIMAVTDGKTIRALEPAQDHKRVYDNDTGPNTGGMGAYSPAPVITPGVLREIEHHVLQPALAGLRQEKIDYHGVLYAGVMIHQGHVQVLEFNVRFGDPETQAVLPRLRSDFIELCLAVADGRLQMHEMAWDPRPAVCVVLAAGGYPGPYHQHHPISGLAQAAALADVAVFHGGTERRQDQVVTKGGRVLGVTALGDNLSAAIARAYQAVACLHFEHAHFRWDIGAKALARL